MRIVGLARYPLKSGRGEDVERCALDAFGLADDRRWALVDANGEALSQKSHPPLARVAIRWTVDAVTLSVGDAARSVARAPRAQVEVQIWRKTVRAGLLGDVGSWLHEQIGVAANLVEVSDTSARAPTQRTEGAFDRCSFPDAYPISVVSTASLDALNARLDDPVDHAHFRINVLVDGLSAFQEDQLAGLSAGSMRLRAVKPIERCSMVGIDQHSGDRLLKPLTELARLRPRTGSPLFGVYMSHLDLGTLSVGQELVELPSS